MYQCLKVSKITKGERVFYLSKFLDVNRAEVFTVYTSAYPAFDVGSSYDLKISPSFKSFNFLQDE